VSTNKPLLLIGGGLDSVAVFLSLVRDGVSFDAIHIDYGQIACHAERKSIESLCSKYEVPLLMKSTCSIKELNDRCSILEGNASDSSPVANGRNLLLALIAAKYSSNLYMGLDKPYNGASPFPDTTEKYIQSLAYLLSATYEREIVITAPYLHVDKVDVCRDAYQIDRDFFNLSMTCWLPVNGAECGVCKHCCTKRSISKFLGA